MGDDDVHVESVSTLNVEDVAVKIRPEFKVAKFSNISQANCLQAKHISSTDRTSSLDVICCLVLCHFKIPNNENSAKDGIFIVSLFGIWNF
jgi:hypothetical protein